MTTTRRTLLAAVLTGAIGLGGTVACTSPGVAPAPAAAPAPVSAQAPAAGDSRSAPRIADAWARAWNSGDPQRLAALFTDDARYTDHAFGPTFTGRDGVATWASTTAQGVGNLMITIDSAFRGDDQVAVRWTFSGHLTGAPTPFTVPAATVLTLRGEQIAGSDDFYNLADVLRQSGLPADTSFTAP